MNLKELKKEIIQINNKTDGITDELINKIEDYQTRYESLLLKKKFALQNNKFKTTGKNYQKALSMSPMEELGFSEIAVSHVKNYKKIGKEQINYNLIIGIETDIDFEDLEIVKNLRNLDLASMYDEAQALDNVVKRNLVNAIATGQDHDTTISNIAEGLLGAGEKTGKLAVYATTYLRTSLFGLGRMIDKEIYDKVGVKKFIYWGPDDSITRPFCRSHIGKTYTESQIEKFPEQNRSGLDPWFAPGGWNCRHRLIPAQALSE